jgi:two-component system cell cycle response regulator DivK
MKQSLQDAVIIVVEDDPNAQLVAVDLLRLGGALRCYLRKSADAALIFAEKLPRVDLFLVDINMPGHSGYDFIEMVRGHEALCRAKVVAVTAGTLSADVQKAREAGFDGFVGKPLKADRFAEQVQRILNEEIVWDWR